MLGSYFSCNYFFSFFCGWKRSLRSYLFVEFHDSPAVGSVVVVVGLVLRESIEGAVGDYAGSV